MMRAHPSQSYRRTPRLDPMGLLDVALMSDPMVLSLVDVGLEGFGVLGPVPIPIGTQHQFRFTTASGASLVLDGEAVASRTADVRDPGRGYVTGFKFLVQGPEASRALEALIDTVTSPLTFL